MFTGLQHEGVLYLFHRQVLVEPGQQVEEGEVLVIMEAMKMQVKYTL